MNQTYLYTDPYEPVVHGSYGEGQSLFSQVLSKISDFFAELMTGGRGFGHPEYTGYVPI